MSQNSSGSIKIPYQQTSDRQINLFQTQLAQALQPITQIPNCKSTLLTNQTINTSATTVQTSLGYPLSGWQIVRLRGNSVIWDSQDSNSDPNTTLILTATAQVVVDLLVW